MTSHISVPLCRSETYLAVNDRRPGKDPPVEVAVVVDGWSSRHNAPYPGWGVPGLSPVGAKHHGEEPRLPRGYERQNVVRGAALVLQRDTFIGGESVWLRRCCVPTARCAS